MIPDGLVAALLDAAQHTTGRALVATDGGSAGEGRDLTHRRGAVGIAVRSATGDQLGFRLPRPGLDQTAYGAELWGLWVITAALAEAAVPADVFIDNLSVVRGGRRAWADGVLSRRQPEAWHAIQTQARRIADATLHWCPSHGKNPEWVPALGFCAQEVRELNDLADEQVSLERDRLWALGKVARVARSVQHDRAASALRRLHRGL